MLTTDLGEARDRYPPFPPLRAKPHVQTFALAGPFWQREEEPGTVRAGAGGREGAGRAPPTPPKGDPGGPQRRGEALPPPPALSRPLPLLPGPGAGQGGARGLPSPLPRRLASGGVYIYIYMYRLNGKGRAETAGGGGEQLRAASLHLPGRLHRAEGRAPAG